MLQSVGGPAIESAKQLDQGGRASLLAQMHKLGWEATSRKPRKPATQADKIRVHPFEGTVIRKTGKGLKETFTVRKVSFGEGVERVFPLHSPVIDSLQVISKGMVCRSKLYYLRERVGKETRIKKQESSVTPSP